MKHTLVIMSLLGFIFACSGLPQVYPGGDSPAPQPDRACRGPFPDGDWQLLHSIEATLPGGKQGFLMGLTVISSSNRTARCVIMTLEGFVVFDAWYEKKISVNRAVAPFDAEVFASGLIDDINLIFFKPPGSVTTSGFLKNGAAVCRYQKPDGRMVDIISRGEHRWEIRQYLADHLLARTVKIMSVQKSDSADPRGDIDKIELIAHGSPGYILVMDLVEAIPLAR